MSCCGATQRYKIIYLKFDAFPRITVALPNAVFTNYIIIIGPLDGSTGTTTKMCKCKWVTQLYRIKQKLALLKSVSFSSE